MHQTTVRFAGDTWSLLEGEAASLGISAAQYVREAAIARAMYTAGRRGDTKMNTALLAASESERGGRGLRTAEALEHSRDELDSSAAVWAQARVARERARELRDEANARRRDVVREGAP